MENAEARPDETAEARAPRVPPAVGRALVPVPHPPRAAGSKGFGRSHGFVAGAVALVMGTGFVAGTALFAGKGETVTLAKASPAPDPTLDALVRVQGEVRALKASLDGLRATAENTRQDDTIRGLKKSVDTLKGDIEGVKAASTGAVGQLTAKLDRLDRDPAQKLADIAARIDRMERQAASADTTGSLPSPALRSAPAPVPPPRAAQAAAPAATVAAVPHPEAPTRPETPAKPDLQAKAEPAARPEQVARQDVVPKPAVVEGWMLRDVYGGVALLEGRAGGLREVAPGQYVPGVGEIRSIERRGRAWVVVTSRGLIQADNRW